MDKRRVAALASRQFGIVAVRQLAHIGVARSTIAGWRASGYLYRQLPGVYAVGHIGPSDESELTAALLWSGPGAMLDLRMGAWWLGLMHRRPAVIEVATPRHCRPRPGIAVRSRVRQPRIWHRGLPVAPVAEILLGLAAGGLPHDDLRRALAEVEYRDWLDLETLKPRLGRGVPGSVRLRAAIAHHEPRLAMTRSELERRMLALCTRAGLPLPRCNVRVAGFLVDALWAEQRVVVEVDGRDGHRSWAQTVRDRHRDLALRRERLTVLRYVWDQLTGDTALVEDDLARTLGERP